jgi:MoxR-like ATPase
MNTLGQGNLSGLYHGTQMLNHAQLDRWNLVTSLDYLAPAERAIVAEYFQRCFGQELALREEPAHAC